MTKENLEIIRTCVKNFDTNLYFNISALFWRNSSSAFSCKFRFF